MVTPLSRRTLVTSAATASAVGASAIALGAKPSSVFAAPAFLQGAKVEVKYWTSFTSGVYGDAQNALIANFMAANPDITITPTSQSDYGAIAAALIAALQTGDEPHLAILSDNFWFRFYLAQALADIKPLLAELKVDTDDFIQPLYTEFGRNDAQYMVPFARSTPLFYYNADALKASGLDESIFETWSGFAESASKLAVDTIQYGLGLAGGHPTSAWMMQGPMWAFGGAYSTDTFDITLNQPEGVATGEFFQKLVQNKVAGATADPAGDFQKGTTASTIASTGAINFIKEGAKFTVAAAALPKEKQIGCPTGGAGLAILESAPDDVKLAAAKFIDFCTNTENAATWAQATGYMPVRTSSIESDSMQAFLKANPLYEVAIKQLPNAHHPDSAMNFFPNGSSLLTAGWDQVFVKDAAVQDAFDQTAADLEDDKKDVEDQLKSIEG
ncbi:MAG: ABC transporter substrate-binding protein [Thermomicrobiales bacterium]